MTPITAGAWDPQYEFHQLYHQHHHQHHQQYYHYHHDPYGPYHPPSEERFLYDLTYIESNCTLPYDDRHRYDTTYATYVTNYAMGVLGLACVLLVLIGGNRPYACRGQFCTSEGGAHFSMLLYFALTGLGYSIAGVGHQYGAVAEDAIWDTTKRLYISVLVPANFCFVFVGLSTFTQNVTWKWMLLVSHLVLLVALVVTESMIGLGVVLVVSYLYMGVSYCCVSNPSKRYLIANAVKCLACLLMVSGLLVQVFLGPVCGSGGYQNCFRDCPYPLSVNFNHNALFHVMAAIALVLQGLAEAFAPTILAQTPPSAGTKNKAAYVNHGTFSSMA